MLKFDIEEIVGKYCDGTWTNLDNSYFVESAKPQKMADELVEYIESLLTKRAPDLGWTCECEAVNWQALQSCGICGKPRPSG